LPVESAHPFKSLIWSNNGESFVFQSIEEENSLINHFSADAGLQSIDKNNLKKLGNYLIPEDSELLLSDDGKHVFFSRLGTNVFTESNPGIEEWNTLDPLEYPRLSPYNLSPLLTYWDTQTQKIAAVETEDFPSSYLNP